MVLHTICVHTCIHCTPSNPVHAVRLHFSTILHWCGHCCRGQCTWDVGCVYLLFCGGGGSSGGNRAGNRLARRISSADGGGNGGGDGCKPLRKQRAMENVVRAWSPPPERPSAAGSGKKTKDRQARKGELSASVVWRSNSQLGAYRNKFLMDDHDAKMRSRLNNVKPTISMSLDPAIVRTRRRGATRWRPSRRPRGA